MECDAVRFTGAAGVASLTGPGSSGQAALELDPRELWVAAYVPQLPLLALLRRRRVRSTSAPLVVVDAATAIRASSMPTRKRAGGRSAHRHDTGRGARGRAASSMPRPRDAARELALMQRLAGIAAAFTPQVSIEPPDGLLLEIKPSAQAVWRLACSCAASCAMPAARIRCSRKEAACSRVSRWRRRRWPRSSAARAGARCFLTDPNQLPARLKPLPIECVAMAGRGKRAAAGPGGAHARRAPAPAARGVRQTVRHRESLPISTGCSAVAPIRAAGSLRRERYTGRVDLDHEIEDHERILEALRPLLNEVLEQFLRTRQRGITALLCRFHHYRALTHFVCAAAGAPGSQCRAPAGAAARAPRQPVPARARAAM